MTLEAVVIAVGVIATVISVAVLVARLPGKVRPPAPPPPPRSRSRPAQLRRIERIIERSGESGLAAHTQLRPLVLEVAEARLARRGLRLDRDEGQARHLLGPEIWELVRSDRAPPPDARSGGIPGDELEALLDRLEAL